MDGVLVDSEPRHIQAFLEVFREMGFGENHGMDFTAYYGRSDRALWSDFVERHHPPYPIEHLIAWKQRRFIEIIRREKPIFPAIPGLLDRLSPRYVLGLASGSVHPVIEEVLALRNLRWYFQAVASIQDVEHPKPAPDVFLRAADLLNVRPAECCVLEDAAVGVEAARKAGMDVIAITNTLPREQLTHATHVVQNYEEIEKLLLSPHPSDPRPSSPQGRRA